MMRPRPQLTDPDERDDIKQILSAMTSSLQRERARADQFYVRSRNVVAYGTALFTAVQVAFLANIGRATTNEVVLMDPGERNAVAWAALIGLLALLAAVGTVFAYADRAQDMTVTSAKDAATTFYDETLEAPVLEALMARLEAEDDEWERTNEQRRIGALRVAGLTGFATLVTIVELVLLYRGLAA